MKYTVILLALLLTGCTGTDIRGRISPDLLAADPGTEICFAARDSSGTVISAAAESPLRMEDALHAAAGESLSTGHLSLLLLGGAPAQILPDFCAAGRMPPTCDVLYCPDGACRLLKNGQAPAPEQIRAAVQTGMLPCRSADAVLGDLWGGSGVTALTALHGNRLTLTLFHGDIPCGTLSEDACRGLALIGKRWERFSFSAAGETFFVQHALLRITVTEAENRLCFAVSGRIFVFGAENTAARDVLCRILGAALTETASQAGADLLTLREAALREGISAADCPQEAWRVRLMQAEYRTEPEVIFTVLRETAQIRA